MAERSYRWSELPHLAKRTLWSLRRPVPDPEGEAWLLQHLSPGESLLYRAMSAVDRAHAIGCARHVESLGPEVVVASALHDVGKTDAGLGTPGRVLATLCGLVIAPRAHEWRGAAGMRGQIERYLDHAERGSEALRAVGSTELAVAWAREHHLPPSEWTIDGDIGRAMLAADEAVDG